MADDDGGNGTHVSRREMQTEFKSFRNEVRLLVVGSLFANQALNHADPTATVQAIVTGVPLALAAGLSALHWLHH